MKVVKLGIENFRGIRCASLCFDGHTLLVGTNNVGKSTICEALDLVLGPDRLNRFPPIDEHDFYNGIYLFPSLEEGLPPTPIRLRIEAVLIGLSVEVSNRCGGNSEFWHLLEKRVLASGEIASANPPDVVPCLRIETIGLYDIEEDEFVARTYFSHSPDAPLGELTAVPKTIKRQFGFLYLRTLRTGSRALSLERGSLLDIILRAKGVRHSLWQKTISRLQSLDIEADATEIAPVLRSVEKRLSRYVALESPGNATKLHVSELTREHLRKTLTFFMALSADQAHVPFAHAGTGTINTLVLALLSLIADLKSDVIFAMEEPEIAVPPHTQRRIAEYLLTKTTQAFVTSHSPFVIEKFEPSQTLLLARQDAGTVTSRKVSDATGLKDNDYSRFAKSGLSECMLSRGVIVVEGVTELHAMPVIARRMEEQDPSLQPLDISGVAFFDADGESNVPKFGKFFKTLGLRTFAFYDLLPKGNRKPEVLQALADTYEINTEHPYKGFEGLLAAEVPASRLWSFLLDLKISDESGNVMVPELQPSDAAVRSLAMQAVGSNKGAGWAARLLNDCEYEELPGATKDFLSGIYKLFPRPVEAEEESQSDDAWLDDPI